MKIPLPVKFGIRLGFCSSTRDVDTVLWVVTASMSLVDPKKCRFCWSTTHTRSHFVVVSRVDPKKRASTRPVSTGRHWGFHTRHRSSTPHLARRPPVDAQRFAHRQPIRPKSPMSCIRQSEGLQNKANERLSMIINYQFLQRDFFLDQ